MVAVKALFDTNILIDYLNGVEAARLEIARYDEPEISIISWMEVLVGAKNEREEGLLRGFLERFTLISLNPDIAEKAVQLRRGERLRLPDAIIWATATTRSCLLVSRNTRDFPADHPGVRVPYRI